MRRVNVVAKSMRGILVKNCSFDFSCNCSKWNIEYNMLIDASIVNIVIHVLWVCDIMVRKSSIGITSK